MVEKNTRGEMHGCIVCGKLYQLYVVKDAAGKFVDAKVMSAGGKLVPHGSRPLVACETHTDEMIESAVVRVFDRPDADED